MAIFHVQHTPIGRTTHEPGTAGAHLRYILRASACTHVLSKGISKEPHAAQRWIDDGEVKDRKNARVCDKILLSLPVEFDLHQNIALIEDFASKLSRNQVPWMGAIHMSGDDALNPHCHFVLRDRHFETGRRVVKTTEKGSTEYIRMLWERAVNDSLERAGVEKQVSRLPKAEQVQQVDIVERDTSDNHTFEFRVQRLLQARDELVEYRRQMDILESLKQRAVSYDKAAGTRNQDLDNQRGRVAGMITDYQQADSELKEHQKPDGSLRGVSIGIGRFKWKSKTRQQAELKQEEAHIRKAALDNNKIIMQDMEALKQQADENREQAHREYLERRGELSHSYQNSAALEKQALLGSDEDLETARVILQNTLRTAARNVTDKELAEAYSSSDINDDKFHEIRVLKQQLKQQEGAEIIEFPKAEEPQHGGMEAEI